MSLQASLLELPVILFLKSELRMIRSLVSNIAPVNFWLYSPTWLGSNPTEARLLRQFDQRAGKLVLDWEGKSYGDRLRTSAVKFRDGLVKTNISALEEGRIKISKIHSRWMSRVVLVQDFNLREKGGLKGAGAGPKSCVRVEQLYSSTSHLHHILRSDATHGKFRAGCEKRIADTTLSD
ncbi:hypothetical protein DFH07DRAFT_769421 [Mycena maculata]|nr:hypothetical protein DFH07DRAFT_772147 [Mycena maculata]KAJ7767895.1 hypothetical protein DFH07DRAFT_769421 [Mycena maculata]